MRSMVGHVVSCSFMKRPSRCFFTLLLVAEFVHAPAFANPQNISVAKGASGGTTSTQINQLGPGSSGTITDGQLNAELVGNNVLLDATGTLGDAANVSVTSASASSLTLQGGTISLAGAYNVAGGLVFNATGAGSTVTGTVNGGGGVTVTGGDVAFTSNESIAYTGSTRVSNGASLLLTSPVTAVIGSTAFYIDGPSTLTVYAERREDIRGTLTFDAVGGGTLDFAGTNTNGGVVMRTNLTIVATGGAQDTVMSSSSYGLNLSPNASTVNTLTLDTSDPASRLLVSSRIWNRGNLTKTGPGTAQLTFSNTYSNVTTISGGTLSVTTLANGGSASGIGSSSNAASNLILNGGALQYTGSGASTNRLFTLGTNNGSLDASGTGALSFTNTGAIALSDSGARVLVLTGSNTGANTLASTLRDNGGPTTLAKGGAGTWLLTGVNSYSGTTLIEGGTLSLSGNGSIATSAGVVADSVFDISRTNNGASITSLAGVGGVTLGGRKLTLTNAADTFAGVIGGTGGVTLANGSEIFTGTNTYTGGTSINAGVLQLGNGGTAGSITGNVLNNGALVFDRSNTVTFDGSISGSGSVTQMGSGTTAFTAASSYTGPTTVQGGTLAAGANNVFSPASDVVVESGAALDLRGFAQTLPNLTNAGLVRISSDPGNVLTVSNYIGQGGTLAINTYLGGDGSPSDRLVINGGTATGTTKLAVTNVGGPGGFTHNGIQVIDAINGGTTAADAFALNGDVRVGAFNYLLFRGGLNGASPDDWFLRSTFVVPGEPITGAQPPDEPIKPGIPTLPVDPPHLPLPPGDYPIIGPELATNSVVQPFARELGLTTIGTLHERVGDTLTSDGGGDDSQGWGSSGWARVFGQHINNRYQTYSDAQADGSLTGFQTGVDLWRGSLFPDQRDAIGVYFAYGNADSHVDGLVTNADATGYVLSRTGSVDLNAYTAGAYWTHYGPHGWYVDAVIQGSSYDGHASTEFAYLPTFGSGLAASLESGYPISLALGPGFELEPQAQFVWQHARFDKANDGLGVVGLGTTSGVTGRLGLRAQWTITGANGQVWQPYVRTNVWHDWGGHATTNYADTELVPLNDNTSRMDVAAGLTARLAALMSLYGQVGYQFSVSDSQSGNRRGAWGDIGVRFNW